jgi:hypothetical protein
MDDFDAITPCPIASTASPEMADPIDDMRTTTRSASPSSLSSSLVNRRRESVKALEEGTGGDPDRLWKRMLALQERYGCYNSARMSAALSSGNVSILRRKFTSGTRSVIMVAANHIVLSLENMLRFTKRAYDCVARIGCQLAAAKLRALRAPRSIMQRSSALRQGGVGWF